LPEVIPELAGIPWFHFIPFSDFASDIRHSEMIPDRREIPSSDVKELIMPISAGSVD
jgi:hypothetical protein